MSTWKKPASILALGALIAVPFAARSAAPAHHQAASVQAAHVVYVAPLRLDTMQVSAAFRLTSVRREVAREERAEARAQARRQHEAVLLAARQRVLAVQAARVHVAAAVAVRARAVAPAVSGGTYGLTGLESLWRKAGGALGAQSKAACIAMHESRGRQFATGAAGERGYWQINPVNGDLSTYNAYGNARSAVLMSRDGTDWSAWTTARDC